MEFCNLGKRCSLLSCKQLDFLPFSCSHCGDIFCKDHFIPDKHNCTAIPDVQIKDLQSASSLETYFNCSYGNCSITNAVALLCPKCKKHFCVSHRHHSCFDQPATEEDIKKWNSPTERFNAAKSNVDCQVSSRLNEKAKKKGNSTALKVQLMRLKGRAKGPLGVPVEERSYFLVHPPLQYASKSLALYVGRNWSLGRVIDSLAESCKVSNRNNDATALKLRLFKHSDGQMLSPVTKILQNFLDENILHDGSSIVMEYISEDNIKDHVSIDTSLYKE